MLRTTPPGEDATEGVRSRPVPFGAPGTPPGEDRVSGHAPDVPATAPTRTINSQTGQIDPVTGEGLENHAQRIAAEASAAPQKQPEDFLRLVMEAEQQALLYVNQVNRKSWSQTLRAFHNEHGIGSKYTRPEWRGRSKLFVPKTRAAVRKDMAAVAASLFNNIDAINCIPGNEADPRQRGAAAVMEELVNYRTDRVSGKASFPWFLISMGARQDAVLTGVCCTKQSWKQTHRKVREERELVPNDDGVYEESIRDVYEVEYDRPEMQLVPPENYVIDPGACWTNPAQKSAYLILKWPMQLEEVRDKQNAPINPWNDVPEDALQNALESAKWDMAAVRRARELGLDRLDETQTGTQFKVVWVYENFLRVDGEDWTFYSLGHSHFMTDPKPVREAYPEQHGERPITIGYGNLEAHRIFPMSPAESWQPLQLETNDIRNLQLDATKQNVMPISKVRRGRQIDLDQVRRRSSGSSILVQEPDDVTWEQAPGLPESGIEMAREIGLEFDDLAGQQNFGSVETNNALGKTLGGLKLAAGAANSVQEWDIRVWIETWAAPALAQIVRLEQYYEADPIVLGIAGQKAQLFEKYGINRIDDELLEQEVTVRVSVGLGAGDPMQRLSKFEAASNILAPIIQIAPEFMSGQKEINVDAMIEEVYGAAGYKDGGARFFKDNGQPRPNPQADLQTQMMQARIEKDKRTGQASYFQGLSALAKVALGKRELEASVVDSLLGRQIEAHSMGSDHGHRHSELHLSAFDHGHRHGMAIADHRRQLRQDANEHALRQAEAQAGGDEEMEGAESPSPAPSGAGPQGQPSASPPPNTANMLMSLLQSGQLEFTRDQFGRIAGIKLRRWGAR